MGLTLGSWQSSYTLTDLAVEPTPGADPAEAQRTEAAIRPKVGIAQSFGECLWDSPELMFIPGLRIESGCDFSRVEASGGRFAVTTICRRPQGGVTMQTSIEGDYTPETMAGRSEIIVTTGQVRIRMKATSRSRFAGQCPLPPVIMAPPPPPKG
jgi:hypothetical protein